MENSKRIQRETPQYWSGFFLVLWIQSCKKCLVLLAPSVSPALCPHPFLHAFQLSSHSLNSWYSATFSFWNSVCSIFPTLQIHQNTQQWLLILHLYQKNSSSALMQFSPSRHPQIIPELNCSLPLLHPSLHLAFLSSTSEGGSKLVFLATAY